MTWKDVAVQLGPVVAAGLFPLLMALVNNRHQIKLRAIEMAWQNRETRATHVLAAFEQYAAAIGPLAAVGETLDMGAYHASYYLAYLHAGDGLREKMQELDAVIHAGDLRRAADLALPLLSTMRQEISERVDAV
jgi:hypothetical protein